jgi:hypothetical protein
MLQLNPRDRASAVTLLSSPELLPKLHLDEETSTSFSQHSAEKDRVMQELLQTIKVPQSLQRLNLPKPCYPDARPNSPSAWTVAEQRQVSSRKPPPLPPVPSLPIPSDNKENQSGAAAGAPALPSYREEAGVMPPNKMAGRGGQQMVVAPIPYAPPLGTEGGALPAGVIASENPVPNSMVEEYFNRRPLASLAHANNKQNIVPVPPNHAVPMAPPSFIKAAHFHPSLDPILAGAAAPAHHAAHHVASSVAASAYSHLVPSAPPTGGPPSQLFAQPHQPTTGPVGGRPSRLQYHHRAW